jgi:cell division protein ZapE
MMPRRQSPASAPDLHALYRVQLGQGWQPDASQVQAVNQLQSLLGALGSDCAQPPKGLWLYGPPGRGKSRLLDLFMQLAPTPAKRRVHFHTFMEEIHRRLHAMEDEKDILARLAAEIAAESTVLGFDEFYLTNIADAMLLGRLMKLLFAKGAIVVATSNWALPGLFQGGLHRERFLPFLRLMEAHLAPVDLREGPDWRQRGPGGPASDFLIASGAAAAKGLKARFETYAQGPEQPKLSRLLADWRPRAQKGGAVWLTFAEACDKPRGRADYAALAGYFDTVVLEGVPVLGPKEADAAIRLVTLVDLLYENHRRLVVSAAAPMAQLCPAGDAAEVFRRTASRLAEMTSRSSER